MKKKALYFFIIIAMLLSIINSIDISKINSIKIYLNLIIAGLVTIKFRLNKTLSALYETTIPKLIEGIVLIAILLLEIRIQTQQKLSDLSIIETLKKYRNFNEFNFSSFKGIIFEKIWILIILSLCIYLAYQIFNKNIKKAKTSIDEEYIFSFREKEIQDLESAISKEKIKTILIDDKIGNGKTFLIEKLIERLEKEKGVELIYLKLPLIDTVEVLKEIIYSEIIKILKKNDIFIKKEDIFFKNLTSIKLSIFEWRNNSTKSNWDIIQELKKGIEKLSKPILIIIDDIEREESSKKVRETITFVGEFLQYLKNLKIKGIFLAQYDKISTLNENGNKEIESSLNKFDDICYYEKYFDKVLKLHSPSLLGIQAEDIQHLIKELKKDKTIDSEALKIHAEIFKIIFNFIGNEEFKDNNFKLNLKNINIRTINNYLKYFDDFIEKDILEYNIIIIFQYMQKALDLFIELEPTYERGSLNSDFLDPLFIKIKDYLETQKIDVVSSYYTKLCSHNALYKGGVLRKERVFNDEKVLYFFKTGDTKEVDGMDLKCDSRILDEISNSNINSFFSLNITFEDGSGSSPKNLGEKLIELIIRIGGFTSLEDKSLEKYLIYLKGEIQTKYFYMIQYNNPENRIPDPYAEYPEFSDDIDTVSKERSNKIKDFLNLMQKDERRIIKHMNYPELEKELKRYIITKYKNAVDFQENISEINWESRFKCFSCKKEFLDGEEIFFDNLCSECDQRF